MSFVFDLDTDGQRAVAAEAAQGGISVDQLGSGFWDGVPKSIGLGVMRGGARAARAVGMAGGGLLSLFEDSPGALTDRYFKALDDYTGNAVDFWTPRAQDVGAAGRILGGFSEMALPLMAGGGNPALMIGTAELGGAEDLVKQGASAPGAVAGGIIQGLATAAGFRIPFLGRTLSSRIASGIAGNVAVNAGGQVATKQVLKATGDTEQAQEINPLDLESRLVDVLSGAAFGGIAHLVTPSVRDAAATAANAKHFQEDTAPGVPADLTSSMAHQAAMEAAIRATLEGKPVDLSGTGIQDADFIALPRPFGHLPEPVRNAAELRGVDEALRPTEPLQEHEIVNPIDVNATPEEKLQQIKALTAENKPKVQAIIDDLNKALPGTKSGLNVKTDESILAKSVRPEILARKPWFGIEHIRDTLRFKTVLDRLDQLPQVIDTLKRHGVSVVKVDTDKVLEPKEWGWRIAALDLRMPNGQLVEHYMPIRELEGAKKAGNHKLFENWRARDINSLKPEEYKQMLADMRASNDRYQAAWEAALARTGEGESAVRASLNKFSASARSLTRDQSAVSPTFQPSGADHLPSIRTPQKSGARTLIIEPSGDRETRKSADITNTSRQSIPEGSAKVSDPIVSAANQALTERDFLIPTGEINEDGSPVLRSAREVMAEADAAIVQAQQDAKGFEALAQCILTKGDG